VFSSPQSYSVETTAAAAARHAQSGLRRSPRRGRELLPARRPRRGPWCGSPHDDRRLVVEPAPRGKKPTWGGFIPQFLGFDLCQQDRRGADLGAEAYAYLDAEARRSSPSSAGEGWHHADRAAGIIVGDDEIRWWTFAGGRINSTLRYALEALGATWKIVPDNFGLTIRGEDLTQHASASCSIAPRARGLGEREAVARRRRGAAELPPEQVPAAHAAVGRARGGGRPTSSTSPARGAGSRARRRATEHPPRVPAGSQRRRQQDLDARAPPLVPPACPPIPRDPARPFHWITSDGELPAPLRGATPRAVHRPRRRDDHPEPDALPDPDRSQLRDLPARRARLSDLSPLADLSMTPPWPR
jgi:hypothetical protein